MDRRTVLMSAVGALASGPLLRGGAPAPAGEARAAGKLPLVINGLGGLSDPNCDSEEDWTPLMFQDLRASGLTALNQTVGHVYGPGDPFEATVRDIARTHQRIRTNASRLRLIQAASEIRDCRREGKAGIILGFQNTLMLGAQADRVGLFADLGVKVIQLTYNDRNPVGDGGLVPENRGLTAFGREVVAELNRTRTLVDLSHSGENTCLDAIASSKVPITISHSGCRALCDRPRNKTDRELRALADRGGVLGIYFMPYLKDDSRPRAEDVVHHIEHAWNVCGEDHVALGTDGTACRIKDLEGMRRAISEDVARRKAAGVSAPGEIAGVLPLVEDLTGPGQFHRLSDLLKARGHASARIEKLLGSNLLRLYADIWGG